MEPIKPRPPVIIEVDPPEINLRKGPSVMLEKFKGWKSKTIFRSKTVLTVLFTVIAFVTSKFFGLELDWKSVVDVADGLQGAEIIALVGLIVTAVVRAFTKPTDLSTPN